jgi:pantoate--beta-alanine ligase
VTTRDELRAARAALPGPVGVVMTMGALHDGHASLLRAARAASGSVLATIFVNPTQFGPSEDFDRYPRTLDADLAICKGEGVDLVFAPSREQMYPKGLPSVTVHPGPVGEVLEGASRRGFLHGVLTVVMKLLHLTTPDAAYFGEKDYQQLTMIRAMVADLDLPVDIVGVPTVREPDGLARSSRNRYLSDDDRRAAVTLWRALCAGRDAGGRGPDAVLAAAAAVLAAEPAVHPDYLALADPALGTVLRADAAGPAGAPVPGPAARLLVAARVGGTRLIDNLAVEVG